LIGPGDTNDCHHGNGADNPQNSGAIPGVTGEPADLSPPYPLPWIGDFGARHGELWLAGNLCLGLCHVEGYQSAAASVPSR
jgi:hypothetical protein